MSLPVCYSHSGYIMSLIGWVMSVDKPPLTDSGNIHLLVHTLVHQYLQQIPTHILGQCLKKQNFYFPKDIFRRFLGEGFKKKIMENSILGARGGVSECHFPYPFFNFFCSKWSKNHFQTLKFFSCIGGGVSPWGSSSPPLGFIDT